MSEVEASVCFNELGMLGVPEGIGLVNFSIGYQDNRWTTLKQGASCEYAGLAMPLD